MVRSRILVVEGDATVGEHIRDNLERRGYDVGTVISSAEDALNSGPGVRPDLMILNTSLKGAVDGISLAEKFRETMDTPIVFLTTQHSDEMVKRARSIHPLGYLIEPLNPGQLEAVVELALHRHVWEDRLLDHLKWKTMALSASGAGMIALDLGGQIRLMNAHAEKLTGWKREEAFGRSFTEVIWVGEGEKPQSPDIAPMSLIQRFLTPSPVLGHLIHKHAGKIPVLLQTIPLMDGDDGVQGYALGFTRSSNAEHSNARIDDPGRAEEPILKKHVSRRILLASSDPFVRLGFRRALSGYSEWQVESEASHLEQLLEEVGRENWDVVVIDCSMPGFSEEGNIQKLKRHRTDLPILLLCNPPDRPIALRALTEGISSYLATSGVDSLALALRQVADGGLFVSPELLVEATSRYRNPPKRPLHESLSEREDMVFRMIIGGKTTKEIAADLNLSMKTVSTYKGRIMRKMNMKTVAELVSYAVAFLLLQ